MKLFPIHQSIRIGCNSYWLLHISFTFPFPSFTGNSQDVHLKKKKLKILKNVNVERVSFKFENVFLRTKKYDSPQHCLFLP